MPRIEPANCDGFKHQPPTVPGRHGSGPCRPGHSCCLRCQPRQRAEARPANTCRVHVRLVDAQTGKTTPAMACISNANSGEVRLPPDGRVCTKPSAVAGVCLRGEIQPRPELDRSGPQNAGQGQQQRPQLCLRGSTVPTLLAGAGHLSDLGRFLHRPARGPLADRGQPRHGVCPCG